MKTTVTLRVRGGLVQREVASHHTHSAAAVAMLTLPPYIDRLREVQIIQVVGGTAPSAQPLYLTNNRNTFPSQS